jgi:dihydrofolate synthase/folylpolyglutamate synthase
MRFDDLDAWLRWQETLHPKAVDLGLERVQAVWSRLGPKSPAFPLITIAGTNGKGSCASMLEGVYEAAGYRTCCYTSPHLLRYNERIRIGAREVSDADLCAAFQRVDDARGDISLTYFEFGTLASLDLFARIEPEVAILEVGLGGRLDAVNILDADVALVTTIGKDHTAWLGNDLESIAAEKAGIFRPRRPAVVGHRHPAASLLGKAAQLQCQLHVLGRDFDWRREAAGWCWLGPGVQRSGLPNPALRGTHQYDNAAAVLMAVSCLADRLPVSAQHLREGLQGVRLPGRFQVVPGDVTWILDVTHNGQAAKALGENLAGFPCRGKLHAVLGILRDKDPLAIAAPVVERVAEWHLGQAQDPRAMASSDLKNALTPLTPLGRLRDYPDIDSALDGAASVARTGDCILAFGSFTTVEAAMRRIDGLS